MSVVVIMPSRQVSRWEISDFGRDLGPQLVKGQELISAVVVDDGHGSFRAWLSGWGVISHESECLGADLASDVLAVIGDVVVIGGVPCFGSTKTGFAALGGQRRA
jgi:hypothetical protein